MSAEDYLTKAIPIIEEAWDKKLRQRASSSLLPAAYHPKIDVSLLLSEDDALYWDPRSTMHGQLS